MVGCGYLGATHAACMAELGFDVLGLDVDRERIDALSDGNVPFYEPGLEPLLRKHVESGRLSFTTSYAEAAEFADVHFVCVSTPQRDGDFAADLSHVHRVVDELAPLLTRPCVVVGKSTVPAGTAEGLAYRIAELSPVDDAAELAWNPEFLREGHAVEDTLRPDRLVFGVAGPNRRGEPGRAEDVLREIYADPIAAGTPVVVSDYPTAELAKVAANAFLATKISFINAMAELCEATGGDVTVLADAIGHDPRIGRRFLNAGLGFGGGCLPKDIRAFMARAGELGVGEALTFLREVDAINQRRRERVVEIAGELLTRPWPGSRIAVLGAAFKPDSDDIRDSPALNVAGRLHLHGAHVTVYDPQAMDGARRLWPTLHYADSVPDACAGAHVVLVLTEWQQFREMDPYLLADVVEQPAIVDARNCLNPAKWRAAGWTYRGVGR
ncbi:MAG: nucleotide sugar dehydrogenase [Propionibacteriales bacterium]|nr:nucleotide sugar dehydrogenase [Propionibacteriales bacterium]